MPRKKKFEYPYEDKLTGKLCRIIGREETDRGIRYVVSYPDGGSAIRFGGELKIYMPPIDFLREDK